MTDYYPRANRTAQWFGDNYPGSPITPNVLVLHTTEGGSWPSYSGGASAPHFTALPDKVNKRLIWRQHYKLTESSRALRNESGGVETNTLNAVQVELIGSCDRRDGYGAIFWPDAPDWALRDLARFIAWLHIEYPKVKLEAPAKWLPYPSSYGNTSARFTFSEWRNFYGVCGHQHVPENSHGDPGDIDIAALLTYARKFAGATEEPAPTGLSPRVEAAVDRLREAKRRTEKAGRRRWLQGAIDYLLRRKR